MKRLISGLVAVTVMCTAAIGVQAQDMMKHEKDGDGRRRGDVPEQGHHRQRRQLEGPHDAGRRGEGGRPGRHA